MSVSDLTNKPIEFDIDGKTYKVKKLSVLDIFENTEVKIKEKYEKDVSDMAKLLSDKDRGEFLRNAIREMPTGKRMEEMVNDHINTTQGGLDMLKTILNKCQEVSMEEVLSIVGKASNNDSVSSIMAYAISQGEKEATDGETKQKKYD